jgi:signal transduction histidine kinase/DNA-binding NarL/FixJ family response regulator
MRTLLVVTRQLSLASAIQAVLDEGEFQLITKAEVSEAEALLARGVVDVAILDVVQTDARAIHAIEEVRAHDPTCPVLVYVATKDWEWEEEAYLNGAAHVLTKPIRVKLLHSLLERVVHAGDTATAVALAAVPSAPVPEVSQPRSAPEPMRALEALRRFSGMLPHSLESDQLLKQFLLPLREIIGVNRAIVFLRKPGSITGGGPFSQEDRSLRAACAIGLDQVVLQRFALSLRTGIGAYMHRQGRILRAQGPEAQANREIAKEFQLLGAQVAIPILDRESLIGVAVFDERLTGTPYTNDELGLIFHMMEEVGLAIRNSWMHDRLAANEAMVTDILGHLGSGCVVIGANLGTLHANAAARAIFLRDRPGKLQLEFADLPQQLGSVIFTALKTGVGCPPLHYQFPHAPDQTFTIEVRPFRASEAAGGQAALVRIEDVTEHERAQKLEIETSNLRLVKSMAEHLAHEIGNSLVPLSTHQQLIKESIGDPEFQESLSSAMASSVRRISRLANQMAFLAREWQADFRDSVHVADLIVEAFHDAHTFHPGKKVAQLSFNKDVAPWRIAGDHAALRHAFSEIILNALQANPEDPNVSVKLREDLSAEHRLDVEVRDTGKGFSADAARRAPEPFFSTRTVGLGIGLTVSRKIIESHRGTIEIAPSHSGEAGVVRISLPLPN